MTADSDTFIAVITGLQSSSSVYLGGGRVLWGTSELRHAKWGHV